MFINILLWVAVGTASGLLVYFLFPTKKEYLGGIITCGIAGAFFGGSLYSIIRIGSFSVAIDPIASFMAIFGSIMILKLVRRIAKTEEEFLSDRD